MKRIVEMLIGHATRCGWSRIPRIGGGVACVHKARFKVYHDPRKLSWTGACILHAMETEWEVSEREAFANHGLAGEKAIAAGHPEA